LDDNPGTEELLLSFEDETITGFDELLLTLLEGAATELDDPLLAFEEDTTGLEELLLI